VGYYYKYTGSQHSEPEPIRTQRREWAAQWGEIIAHELGGIGVYEHQMLCMIIDEMRRRVEAGDYTHPNRLGPEKPMI